MDQLELNTGSHQGYAVLKTQPDKIVRGERFSVQIEFHNTGSGDNFYNTFFLRGVSLPAQLAVYDTHEKYLGDLLASEDGARTTMGPEHWAFIPSNGLAGATLEFTGGLVPNTNFDTLTHLLPPGKYRLQMIFYHAFIASKPAPESKKPGELEKEFDRRELFRSNPVKIELIDK